MRINSIREVQNGTIHRDRHRFVVLAEGVLGRLGFLYWTLEIFWNSAVMLTAGLVNILRTIEFYSLSG